MTRIWMCLARTQAFGTLLPWIFTHMNHLIPLDRLYETDTLVAFHHPRPAYPLHLLIVPKRAISSLDAIQEGDQDFTRDLFKCVTVLARKLQLQERGYRLIANGGRYQETPLLHFHLISENVCDSSAELSHSP